MLYILCIIKNLNLLNCLLDFPPLLPPQSGVPPVFRPSSFLPIRKPSDSFAHREKRYSAPPTKQEEDHRTKYFFFSRRVDHDTELRRFFEPDEQERFVCVAANSIDLRGLKPRLPFGFFSIECVKERRFRRR